MQHQGTKGHKLAAECWRYVARITSSSAAAAAAFSQQKSARLLPPGDRLLRADLVGIQAQVPAALAGANITRTSLAVQKSGTRRSRAPGRPCCVVFKGVFRERDEAKAKLEATSLGAERIDVQRARTP